MSGSPPVLGSVFPDFEVDTTKGPIKFHEYIEGSWAILFSHPADYTPVCTTELGTVAKYADQFAERGVKLAALSCDDVESHKGWIKDILASQQIEGDDLPYPIIADNNRELAVKLGMLDPAEKDAAGLPMTARAVFVINPEKKLALSLLYPATTGRNFDEILRVVDSLQLTANQKVATPANWTAGKDCMVVPSISDEEATTRFPKGFNKVDVPSGKGYIRLTPDPRA
uniref:Peroxiredoxin-6 n=1 Tax=Thraustochytrium sp. LLF1b TaxID=1112570 RepID=A0A455ZBW0_9STRA|nr:TPA_exp: peroxiredoxin-6 [Thraustochytrium sp. LLF1b]|mmetsp:Transcript_15561/g.27638  ORF Transcript_15561/g.27638 Transcript_15561/m.27638 type:complete len:227 (-) Transcript_15561:55-735(-)|eukprot:CAMPEP_0184542782 /NCGR_PEP_ID=MMETSP0199_2-20130426/2414_1 /TAXON_ID=1112570 /ORGANISM="Thraustochytrium sp., Strain LLF1b" /LENGTH=226 /DNA_ID=CAMNT_0026936695 /DNA_START=94 /DNA_END=774 /DNA_ORIENTATION=+